MSPEIKIKTPAGAEVSRVTSRGLRHLKPMQVLQRLIGLGGGGEDGSSVALSQWPM